MKRHDDFEKFERGRNTEARRIRRKDFSAEGAEVAQRTQRPALKFVRGAFYRRPYFLRAFARKPTCDTA